MKTVYLAGPISGLSYDGALDWREYAIKFLANHNLVGVNPMRWKTYLQSEKVLGDAYEDHVMSTSRGITARDRFDCMHCGCVIANFLGAERVSIGTVMECAWADAQRTPLILVMEKEGNLHDHAMIREVCAYRVTALDEGLHLATAILSPYAT